MKADAAAASGRTAPTRRRPSFIALIASWLIWFAAFPAIMAALAAVGIGPPEFAHGVPYAAVVSVGALLFGWIFRLPDPLALRSLVLGATSLACGALLLPDVRDSLAVSLAKPTPGAPELTLIEYNVWSDNPNPARTIAWLAAANADIVVLVEPDPAFVKKLVQAQPAYRTVVGCSYAPDCELQILSKLTSVGSGSPAKIEPPAMDFASTTLVAKDRAGRDHPIPIVAVHISRQHPSHVTNRQVVDFAAAEAKVVSAAPQDAVIAGDFNAGPWSPPMRWLERRLNANRISAFTPTWPAAKAIGLKFPLPPIVAIDHVFLGKSWRATSIKVGPDAGSDHLPLIVHFQPL